MCIDDFDWYVEWKAEKQWAAGERFPRFCDCGHRFVAGELFLHFGGPEHQTIDFGDVLPSVYSQDEECPWCADDEGEYLKHNGRLLMQDDYGEAFWSATLDCHICRGDPAGNFAEQHDDAMCRWCQIAMRWLDKACHGHFMFGEINTQIGDHFGDEIEPDEQRYPWIAQLAGLAREGWKVDGELVAIDDLDAVVAEAIKEVELVHS